MVKNKKTQNKPDENNNKSDNKPLISNHFESEDENSGSDNSDVNNIKEPQYNRTNLIVSIFAVVIALIAAFFSFKQTEISEDTAQRQLRAYLSTEIIGWQGLDGKYFFATAIRIVNYGQTPAKMVQLAGQIEVLPFPLSGSFIPHYSQINNITQSFTVFPNVRDSTAIGGKVPAKYIFTKEEIARFASDTSKVRVYSFERITYLDVFGVTHHTYSCKFLEPKSIVYKTDGTIRTFMMANYSKFNDID
ncbi:MAG TPA: hypothetical protein VKA26_09590 [Ignavibacteriaceae bacterium]|nr:hypothetical protein [Ignavibacteriaceae bacterium]